MGMRKLQRDILAAMHACHLIGADPAHSIGSRFGMLSERQIRQEIDELVEKQALGPDRTTLTEVGRGSLHIVLAGGVFDIIHPGHIHTLNAAKALGDMLVVVVATDHTAEKMKKRRPLHSEVQRQELVSSLEMVDVCIMGNQGDIFETVKIVQPETIALGYDQAHQEKFIKDGCKRIGLEARVARLQSKMPNISSSKIEETYGDSIHGI